MQLRFLLVRKQCQYEKYEMRDGRRQPGLRAASIFVVIFSVYFLLGIW